MDTGLGFWFQAFWLGDQDKSWYRTKSVQWSQGRGKNWFCPSQTSGQKVPAKLSLCVLQKSAYDPVCFVLRCSTIESSLQKHPLPPLGTILFQGWRQSLRPEPHVGAMPTRQVLPPEQYFEIDFLKRFDFTNFTLRGFYVRGFGFKNDLPDTAGQFAFASRWDADHQGKSTVFEVTRGGETSYRKHSWKDSRKARHNNTSL